MDRNGLFCFKVAYNGVPQSSIQIETDLLSLELYFGSRKHTENDHELLVCITIILLTNNVSSRCLKLLLRLLFLLLHLLLFISLLNAFSKNSELYLAFTFTCNPTVGVCFVVDVCCLECSFSSSLWSSFL